MYSYCLITLMVLSGTVAYRFVPFAGTIGIAGPSLVEETNYVNEPADYHPSISAVRSMFSDFGGLSNMITVRDSARNFPPVYSLVERAGNQNYGYGYVGSQGGSYIPSATVVRRFLVTSPTYRETITPLSPVYSSYRYL